MIAERSKRELADSLRAALDDLLACERLGLVSPEAYANFQRILDAGEVGWLRRRLYLETIGMKEE